MNDGVVKMNVKRILTANYLQLYKNAILLNNSAGLF